MSARAVDYSGMVAAWRGLDGTISERAMARGFGVSRWTIRAALAWGRSHPDEIRWCIPVTGRARADAAELRRQIEAAGGR